MPHAEEKGALACRSDRRFGFDRQELADSWPPPEERTLIPKTVNLRRGGGGARARARVKYLTGDFHWRR
jgi:hypothetical protein